MNTNLKKKKTQQIKELDLKRKFRDIKGEVEILFLIRVDSRKFVAKGFWPPPSRRLG